MGLTVAAQGGGSKARHATRCQQRQAAAARRRHVEKEGNGGMGVGWRRERVFYRARGWRWPLWRLAAGLDTMAQAAAATLGASGDGDATGRDTRCERRRSERGRRRRRRPMVTRKRRARERWDGAHRDTSERRARQDGLAAGGRGAATLAAASARDGGTGSRQRRSGAGADRRQEQ